MIYLKINQSPRLRHNPLAVEFFTENKNYETSKKYGHHFLFMAIYNP